MPRTVWLLSMLAALAAAAWAAAPAQAEEGPARVTVAIMDFHDGLVPDEFQGKVGKICANTLAEALSANKFFEVVERARIDAVVNEIKLEASGLVDPDKAAEIGKLLAVKYLVYGDVQSVEITEGTASAVAGALGSLGGLLGGAAKKVKGTCARVTVNYKVTDVETGKVILTRNIKEQLDVTHAVEGPDARLKVLNETLQKTAVHMAKAMQPKVQGAVAAVNAGDGTIIINKGSQDGVAEGTMLRVYRKGDEIKDPATGEVLDVQITEVCKARCQSVRERISTLEIGDLVKGKRGRIEWKVLKEKAGEIKVGDLVEVIAAD